LTDGEPGLSTERRLFVAIPVPAAARDAVTSLVESVREAGDPTQRDVRWVRLDGLHITVRFLGPTDEERVGDVASAVERAAAKLSPFRVEIAQAGAFPSVARPRALWLAVDTGAEALAAAASTLDGALEPAGWPRQDRPYRAHLTLARSDGVRAGPAVARRLVAAAAGFRTGFQADSIALFESVVGGGPARYVPLLEAPFRGSA
jgi:2'-5' RNA ligase